MNATMQMAMGEARKGSTIVYVTDTHQQDYDALCKHADPLDAGKPELDEPGDFDKMRAPFDGGEIIVRHINQDASAVMARNEGASIIMDADIDPRRNDQFPKWTGGGWPVITNDIEAD